MRTNPVKEKLGAGGTAYGTMMFEFLSPGLPQIAANAGAEFLFYDMEHSGFEVGDIKQQCALCRGAGVVPFVRPPGKTYDYVARLLDVGVMGFLFQMVESAEEAAELVRWTRYPPNGIRGGMFGGAHDDYGSGNIAETITMANARTLIAVLIETERGLANIDEILAVDGIDAVQFGHVDYSISIGLPGQFDHPKLQSGMARIVAAAANHNKAAGALAPNLAAGKELLAKGYRLISVGHDLLLFQTALRDGIDGLSSE